MDTKDICGSDEIELCANNLDIVLGSMLAQLVIDYTSVAFTCQLCFLKLAMTLCVI